MDTFGSQHALPFMEAWAIEMKSRCEHSVNKQHEAAIQRAEIARQIIKIPGFWSRWRLCHARNLTQQVLNALLPAWKAAQFSPFSGGDEDRANEWDQLSIELETIVRMMLEVAVRLRQEPDWYDLRFPRYFEDFDEETMVISRTLIGEQGGALNHAASCVHLAKSPSLVKFEVQSDDQKASICAVEYKAEVLLTDVEHAVYQEPAPRRASWSIEEPVVNQESSRRISW
jgi:hypothetical protein